MRTILGALGIAVLAYLVAAAQAAGPLREVVMLVNGKQVRAPGAQDARRIEGRWYLGKPFLERAFSMNAKAYPDAKRVVVCRGEICHPFALEECRLEEGGGLWIPLETLGARFGWEVRVESAPERISIRETVPGGNAAAPAPGGPGGSGPVEVGQRMPDFALPDLDGKPVRLSDFRGKRVLIVNWASW